MINETPAERADWAILVYISADNVLANFAVESLKQLKRAACAKDGDRVEVVAQVDANGEIPTRRYRFLGTEDINSPIADDEQLLGSDRLHVADPSNLKDFVDWASIDPRTSQPNAAHYCLFLWGHGVELLLDEDDRLRTGTETGARVNRRYLTPANLRKALKDTQLKTTHKKSLDIIGLDACSMSMVEVASELKGYADYMIASQEDVPDQSFPYENILAGLRERTKDGVKKEPKDACRMIAELYSSAFQDYIATPSSGVRAITVSSLNLEKFDKIRGPLTKLSTDLLASKPNEAMRQAILVARSESRDFVFGLFVDLSDFCEQLHKELESRQIDNSSLKDACTEIREALKEDDGGYVLTNKARKQRKEEQSCHGLSIYFPYQRDFDETEEFQVLRAKGGNNRPLKGGNNRPLKERIARIAELEEDFEQLDEYKETGWRETGWTTFIKQGWSFILKNELLDQHYSAKQIENNLLRAA